MYILFISLFLIYIFWIRENVKNRDRSFYNSPFNSELTGVINPSLVSVIIPARNERENISQCLTSIINQSYKELEIVIIDDGSVDGTSKVVKGIQRRNGRLKLIKNRNLPEGWIGKNYALHLGMKEASGEWLLFLDADTELYPDAISKALSFGLSNNVDMVSFSPEQVLSGFWEASVQPVIYEFLSSRFNYSQVNNLNTDIAAANGQFILVKRGVYEGIGGHEAIKDKILEDVALAEKVKQKGFRVYFSYGKGIVRCRMYKSLGEIVQGWTKNLFILVGYNLKSLFKIILRLLFFSLLPFILYFYSLLMILLEPVFINVLFFISASCLVSLILFIQWKRFNELNYPNRSVFLYPLGVAASITLFLISAYRDEIRGEIHWKGRRYPV